VVAQAVKAEVVKEKAVKVTRVAKVPLLLLLLLPLKAPLRHQLKSLPQGSSMMKFFLPVNLRAVVARAVKAEVAKARVARVKVARVKVARVKVARVKVFLPLLPPMPRKHHLLKPPPKGMSLTRFLRSASLRAERAVARAVARVVKAEVVRGKVVRVRVEKAKAEVRAEAKAEATKPLLPLQPMLLPLPLKLHLSQLLKPPPSEISSSGRSLMIRPPLPSLLPRAK
jgi:hypothetical protein